MSRRSVLAAALFLVVPFVSPALAAGGGDPVNGEKLFAVKCGACHSIEPGNNKHGPNLFGIIDRRSASVDGYKYSKALKAAGLTWTISKLNEFMDEPQDIVKGVKMPDVEFNGARERTDIIAYLRTVK
jgi:cytochrome c